MQSFYDSITSVFSKSPTPPSTQVSAPPISESILPVASIIPAISKSDIDDLQNKYIDIEKRFTLTQNNIFNKGKGKNFIKI